MINNKNILLKTKPLIMVISKPLSNACLVRFIWVRLDIQDDTVLTVWSLKVRWSSKVIPRSLAQRVGTRSLPSRDRLKFGILAIIWRLPNSIILVFDALRRRRLSKHQGAVVRNVDNAIQQINHYPVDSVVCFVNTYPLDSDLSGG